jgi:hypothetical protein
MGMMASIAALSTRQYMLGMLILAYCQIQLAEAMIWRGIDTSQPSLNRLGTLYAKYTLPLHLLFVGLGVVMSTDTKYKYIPLLLGILFYAGVVWFYYDDSSIKDWVKPSERDVSFPANRACMKRECQNNENRLQWPFDDQWYILQTFLMYLVFFIYLPSKQSLILFTFFTTTFVTSKMMYTWSTSSIWCFLSAILAPLLVYANSLVV